MFGYLYISIYLVTLINHGSIQHDKVDGLESMVVQRSNR
jgi:hypothetical protein